MKNTLLKIQPRIILYAVVAVSVLFLLALSYILSTQPKPNSATQIFGNDAKNIPSTLSENQEGQTESTNSSTSTKVNVSVNQSTTNGETSGQAIVTVNQNGEEQTMTSDLSQSFEENGFKIRVNNGEVDFNFNFDQESTNETSTEQNIKIKNETD